MTVTHGAVGFHVLFLLDFTLLKCMKQVQQADQKCIVNVRLRPWIQGCKILFILS